MRKITTCNIILRDMGKINKKPKVVILLFKNNNASSMRQTFYLKK